MGFVRHLLSKFANYTWEAAGKTSSPANPTMLLSQLFFSPRWKAVFKFSENLLTASVVYALLLQGYAAVWTLFFFMPLDFAHHFATTWEDHDLGGIAQFLDFFLIVHPISQPIPNSNLTTTDRVLCIILWALAARPTLLFAGWVVRKRLPADQVHPSPPDDIYQPVRFFFKMIRLIARHHNRHFPDLRVNFGNVLCLLDICRAAARAVYQLYVFARSCFSTLFFAIEVFLGLLVACTSLAVPASGAAAAAAVVALPERSADDFSNFWAIISILVASGLVLLGLGGELVVFLARRDVIHLGNHRYEQGCVLNAYFRAALQLAISVPTWATLGLGLAPLDPLQKGVSLSTCNARKARSLEQRKKMR